MADDKTFTKAELDAEIEKAVTKATGDVDGLKTKVEELIASEKKWKAEARKAKDVDPADLERLEAENDELRSKLTAAEKASKDAARDVEKATKALETESAFTQKLLIQDGLKSALISAGVKDEDMLDVLAAKFAAGAKVVIEGDERKALYGDKPLPDFIKEWAGSDVGKKFVAAPANSGGGAGGGDRGAAGGKKLSEADVNAMNPKERSSFFASGGEISEAA
jgi:regulator of replication initiation timing